jgi:small subunit ribosomal protein S4
MGFADSRAQARQLITHGHIDVNGHRLSVPSALVKLHDEIKVHESSKQNSYFRALGQVLEHRSVPEWLSLNAAELSGTVLALPTRAQIDVPLTEQLIVEFYSR